LRPSASMPSSFVIRIFIGSPFLQAVSA